MAKDLTRETSDPSTDMPPPPIDFTKLDLSALRYKLGRPQWERPQNAHMISVDLTKDERKEALRKSIQEKIEARKKRT